jgi:hypothetical protein
VEVETTLKSLDAVRVLAIVLERVNGLVLITPAFGA